MAFRFTPSLLTRFSLLASIAAASVAAGASQAADRRPVSFNRDVRPILSENCFACHGPDKAARKAKLRLDLRDVALEKGAFEPGQPDISDAITRIFSTDPDEIMPPPDSNHSLTAAQRETLKQWVAEGAEYEPHWAFIPPVRPEVPRHFSADQDVNPIDAFIGATLEKAGLPFSPEADKRTLIRRLNFDLTGLPPSSDSVDDFVESPRSDAYATLVENLLASRHYGERMAIPWLDLVRYADTIGFHNDVPIKVWPYRDYVIDTFNRNLPYDQFTREQLAGDLLPGSTITQRVASGYNRLHRISGEGGIQDKEYLAKYAADRVRTTATAFMGATLACAECHDHKFDPYTIRDFYRFEAIFSDLHEKGAYNLSGGFTPENLSEEFIFQSGRQEQQIRQLDHEITRLNREIAAVTDTQLQSERVEWERETLAKARAGALEWTEVKPLSFHSPYGTTLTLEDDQSIFASGINPRSDTYVVTIPVTHPSIASIKIESLSDLRLPGDSFSRSGSAFFISEIEVAETGADGSPGRYLKLANARTSSSAQSGYPPSASIDGDSGTALSFVRKVGGAVAFDLASPWAGGPGRSLTVILRHSGQHPFQNLGRFRFAVHALPGIDASPDGLPAKVLRALKVPSDLRKQDETRELQQYYRSIAPSLATQHAALLKTTSAREQLALEIPSMPVSKSVERRPIRVLPRGNWMDDSGEIVEPGVPGFLRQINRTDGQPMTRLDFAEWLVAPDNPLTARTFVNRLWHQFFGQGLCRTLEDLGSQGAWPSHPELLDWLAVEFRESGWDVKHMVRLIVNSRTYRQSSVTSQRAQDHDPLNQLLSHQARFRLDAELVRDNALAISGLLVAKIGGPSVFPYQPAGYYAALNFPSREYVEDEGENLYRRGLYTHWQRTFLHPSLMAFDAPAREECTANRMPSNTPLQALVLLNDPTYVEAARALAARMMMEGGTDEAARITWAFSRTLSRPPTTRELALLEGLFRRQQTRFRDDPAAAQELLGVGASPIPYQLPRTELAAWTSVGRALLNLHESITRN
ncbi:MAG: DUF1553 domain-containing protein [Opitutaceae bacterium]|nr:DUF1553 domain-containing protein [Opitutaceae bacterium]